MAKTDWTLTDTVKPDDFNNIGREINQLRADVDHIEVPAASLIEAGIVQLSNATDSESESQAATSKALKDVYDLAQSSLTAGNERKAEVVAALVALGVPASTSDSWDTLISKMATVMRATGNATVADVLAGKTASNANGPITGAMPNRGAGGTVTPGTANQSKPAGYYNSPITVLGDEDLVPGNIRSGVDLFGVVGALKNASDIVIVEHAPSVTESDAGYTRIIDLPVGYTPIAWSGAAVFCQYPSGSRYYTSYDMRSAKDLSPRIYCYGTNRNVSVTGSISWMGSVYRATYSVRGNLSDTGGVDLSDGYFFVKIFWVCSV